MTRALRDHVKATIAPYKYPRAIEYTTSLPRTETGKLRRFELRRIAAARASAPSERATSHRPIAAEIAADPAVASTIAI
jgi:2-aminobenzoate-CoA ligase